MSSATLPASVRAYLATCGRSGGTNGKGSAKRRGDSAHYSAISLKRQERPREEVLSHLTTRERKIYLLTELGRTA